MINWYFQLILSKETLQNRYIYERKIEKLFYEIYDNNEYNKIQFNEILDIIEKEKNRRPNELKIQDMSLGQNWYKSNHVVGMMLYVDLFSDNLENLINKIPYLSNLGITLVHLMPLLKSRKGNNDGGYAVLNYLEVDSKFGNMQQLDKIVSELK